MNTGRSQVEAALGGGEASKPLLAKANKEAPPPPAPLPPPLPPRLKKSAAVWSRLARFCRTASLSWELSAHVLGSYLLTYVVRVRNYVVANLVYN